MPIKLLDCVYFQVQHLVPLTNKLRITNETDYYELWSIVCLIDACVGNEPLSAADKVKSVNNIYNLLSLILMNF